MVASQMVASIHNLEHQSKVLAEANTLNNVGIKIQQITESRNNGKIDPPTSKSVHHR